MIKSFADKRAAAIFADHTVRGLPMQIQRRARATLPVIEVAGRLDGPRVLRLPDSKTGGQPCPATADGVDCTKHGTYSR